MIHSDRRILALAICLSGLAGFVDAIGFIELGGYFVSFMSGNSTRLAVGIAREWDQALIAAGLIGAFVVGVFLGSLIGKCAGQHRRPVLLLLVAFLLLGAALLGIAGLPGAFALMAMAMGAENVVFEREGDVPFGLTYMTGALVKFGQRLAAVLNGGPRFGWAPYLLLWTGLVTGAVMGALVHPLIGMNGLLVAALWAAALSFASARLKP